MSLSTRPCFSGMLCSLTHVSGGVTVLMVSQTELRIAIVILRREWNSLPLRVVMRIMSTPGKTTENSLSESCETCQS